MLEYIFYLTKSEIDFFISLTKRTPTIAIYKFSYDQ